MKYLKPDGKPCERNEYISPDSSKLRGCLFELVHGEQWKPIPGFPNYIVSNLGRVCSKPKRRILALRDWRGYWRVGLSKNGRKFNKRVHRLVLMAFVGPPGSGQECAHLDGDRKNNTINNLTWATSKENSDHMIEHGTKPTGEGCGSSKLNYDAVRIIRSVHIPRDKVFGAKPLARAFGVHRKTIERAVSKKSWGCLPREEINTFVEQNGRVVDVVRYTEYIVELQEGCWLAPWSGDPGRTLVKENARVYNRLKGARIALTLARKYRPFKNAKIKEAPNE